MKTPAKRTRGKAVEDAVKRSLQEAASGEGERYLLRLYVTGTTPRSLRAIANIKAICEEHLKGRYDLDVIDIYREPRLAAGDQIVAVPTLIKRIPDPLRRLVGDLSDREKVLLGLDLKIR